MNVGYDGRLYPSNSSAQAGTPPKINERIGPDIRNASPDVQKLVGLIGEAGAMIYKTSERIRNEDFAIDSQKMRLDYARGMENARREMEGKQYPDMKAWQSDFVAREKANRERVLNAARGSEGRPGYFRNFNSWNKNVNDELEILGGRAQLNALQQWNQRQIKDHYASIDQSYKDAVSLGVDGLDMLKAAIDGDDRIPANAKASVYGEKSALSMAMTARNNANAKIQSIMSPEQRELYLSVSESDDKFSKNIAQWYKEADESFKAAEKEGEKLINAGLTSAIGGVSKEQKDVIESRYKKELNSFLSAMNTSRKQLREWFSGIKKEASAKDKEEFLEWQTTGGVSPLTRPGARRFKEAKERKENAGKKADFNTSVIAAMKGVKYDITGLASDQTRLLRAIAQQGSDKEDGTVVINELQGVGFDLEAQRAMMMTAFTEDLILASQQGHLDDMSAILETANDVFDAEGFKQLSEIAGKLVSKEGSAVPKGDAEETVKRIESRLYQSAGVKKANELLLKNPELSSFWAMRKAAILYAQTPNSLQNFEVATNAAIDAAMKEQGGREFIQNALFVSRNIVSTRAARVPTYGGIASGLAPRKESGEIREMTLTGTPEEEIAKLDSKIEKGAEEVKKAAIARGASEKEAERKSEEYAYKSWAEEASKLGATFTSAMTQPTIAEQWRMATNPRGGADKLKTPEDVRLSLIHI